MKFSARSVLLTISLALLGGCAGEMAHREGKGLLRDGRIEDGLAKLAQSTREAPANVEFRMSYLTAREAAVGQVLDDAQRAQQRTDFDEAETLYQKGLKLDANNIRAAAGLVSVEQARRHANVLVEAREAFAKNAFETAEQKLSLVLLENPQNAEARTLKRQIEAQGGRNQVVPARLRDSFRKIVSLEFREANFKQVVEALSRHSGLNFVLDKDVSTNLITTVFLRQVAVEDALDVILTTHQLDKRVLNDTTLLIFPNTAAKQAEHQDLVVKSFFLANANAKQVMEMLKTVIKAKNLYVDEKLNMLLMRDSPVAIRLAERLVALQDVPDAEVMLEVEVLEVQRSKLQELGVKFPDQLTLAPLASSGTTLTLKDLQNINSSRVGTTIPSTVLNLHKDVGETNILANPRIRTRNREKAEIKIGDRVPVITTTSTSTGFVSENVQYVDVGLKLNVEPTIHPDNEIDIRIALEVSSVVKEVLSKSGSLSYQIGGRNASTVVRLEDGETQILGGLINDQERITANRIPGLGDLPLLGRLFASQKDDSQKTELVLSITPRLIRGVAPPSHVPTEFWSGTENNLRLRSLALPRPSSPEKPEKAAQATETNPAITPDPMQHSEPLVNDATDAPITSVPGASAPVLRWEGPTQIKSGESFKLTLMISSTAAVTAVPLQVKFDPAAFELVDAAPGAYLAQGNAKVDFAKRIVGTSGLAFFTQNRAPGEGAKGEGDVLELHMRALKAVSNATITALPTTALGNGSRALPSSGPVLMGLSVLP